jgi:hypothetical protein
VFVGLCTRFGITLLESEDIVFNTPFQPTDYALTLSLCQPPIIKKSLHISYCFPPTQVLSSTHQINKEIQNEKVNRTNASPVTTNLPRLI